MTLLWIALTAVGFAIAGFFAGRLKFKGFLSDVLNLHDINVEISSSAEQISSVSQEIATSSNEQLDTLNTTVSASHEIRSMIEKTTENASMLLQEAGDLQTSVASGNLVIEKMVSSSGDIKTSMHHFQHEMQDSINELTDALKVIQEIAVKTEVINEIVFQTKLLSFNASVEAARAGESGKGFAVVAEEVGKLAQMSGNAAGEISEIVTRSLSTATRAVTSTSQKIAMLAKETIVKADIGFTNANECKDIFGVMETKISSTVEMLKGISAASNEEAAGIAQLDESMSKFQEAADRNRLIASQATQHSITFEKLTEELGKVSSHWLRLSGRDPAQTKTYKRFIWNDRLELHVGPMDDEHKILIGKINTLVEKMELNYHKANPSSVKAAFKDLANYTTEHFADEEKFMESIGYQQLNSHKRIHKKLLEQVGKFGRELDAGRLDDSKLISFLSSWLISHIMGVDMQYAEVATTGRSTRRHTHKKAA